jgi:DNA-binding LytR/AlgR family response regulator
MKIEIEKDEINELTVRIICKEIDENVKTLKNYISLYENNILVKRKDEFVRIGINDVYYIESVDGRSFLYSEKEVYEIDYRLFELEEQLNKKDFYRSSKSQIININHMKSIKPELNRTLTVTMKNNEKLSISRRCSIGFKRMIGI